MNLLLPFNQFKFPHPHAFPPPLLNSSHSAHPTPHVDRLSNLHTHGFGKWILHLAPLGGGLAPALDARASQLDRTQAKEVLTMSSLLNSPVLPTSPKGTPSQTVQRRRVRRPELRRSSQTMAVSFKTAQPVSCVSPMSEVSNTRKDYWARLIDRMNIGNLRSLNELAKQARADHIIHTGDFGFYDDTSLERIADK